MLLFGRRTLFHNITILVTWRVQAHSTITWRRPRSDTDIPRVKTDEEDVVIPFILSSTDAILAGYYPSHLSCGGSLVIALTCDVEAAIDSCTRLVFSLAAAHALAESCAAIAT